MIIIIFANFELFLYFFLYVTLKNVSSFILLHSISIERRIRREKGREGKASKTKGLKSRNRYSSHVMRRLRFLSVTSGYGTTTDDDERARRMQLTTLHEKKQATTTSKPQPQPHTYILDQVVTHLRKEEGRCESVVSGEEKGRKHFHGEGGKVWDSASSGSQRRTNNFNNSIIRLLVERNEGHLFRTISSFATLINHRRSKFSRVEADGTKENVLLETVETRKRNEREKKSLFFLFLFTCDCHDASCYILHKQQAVFSWRPISGSLPLPPPR